MLLEMKIRFKLFIIFGFAMLINLEDSSKIFAQSDIDAEQTKATLKKISDFKYQQLIRVRFKGENVPIKKDREFYRLDNYSIYLQKEFEKEDFTHIIRPYKVSSSATAPIIMLYIPLHRKTTYVLEIKKEVLSYENEKKVAGGVVKGIKLEDKYYKFIDSPPFFDLDVSPMQLNGMSQLIFDIEFCKSWFHENFYIGINYSGKLATNKTAYLNTMLTNIQFKKNWMKDGYIPIIGDLKVENTQDFKQINLVFSIGIETLIRIPDLHLTRTQFSPFPVIKISYEYAKELKDENNDLFGNMNRLSGNLIWKIPFGRQFIIESKTSGIWNLNESKKLYWFTENSYNYRIAQDVSLMIIKYIRGKLPPTFIYQERVSTGVNLIF